MGTIDFRKNGEFGQVNFAGGRLAGRGIARLAGSAANRKLGIPCQSPSEGAARGRDGLALAKEDRNSVLKRKLWTGAQRPSEGQGRRYAPDLHDRRAASVCLVLSLVKLADYEASGKLGGRMYQIFGAERGKARVLIATSPKAGDALTHYRAGQNRFSEVIVIAPDGNQISGFELSRRFEADEQSRYD